MDREYDLFEVFADGSLIWRDSVTGHENAIRRLRELERSLIMSFG
jgi:hypothetical protein